VGSFRVAYVGLNEDFCLGQNTVVIIPNIESIYLFLFLSSKNIQNQIESLSIGSVYKTLSLKNIKDLKISIPTVDILQNFNQITQVLFQKISANNEETLLLSSLRDLLLPQLLSGKLRIENPEQFLEEIQNEN